MKKLLLFGCLLFSLLLLGACNSSSSESSAKATEGLETEKSEETAKTRTYESVKGEIELPLNPERVVVADQDYVGDVLALGVTPIAVTGWAKDTPYFKEQLKDVELVGDKSSVSMEKIASLKPDVIITYNEEYYEKLSKIAPTILLPYGNYTFRESVTEMGKILNKEKEAAQAIAEFDQKMNETKDELFKVVDKDTKVAIVELSDKSVYLFGITYGRGGEVLYNELGLHAPAKVEEVAFETGWADISLEALPEYLGEADHIFFGVRGADLGSSDADRKKEVTSLNVWKDLPAVKNGNLHIYDVQTLYFKDILALDHQLDFITDSLRD